MSKSSEDLSPFFTEREIRTQYIFEQFEVFSDSLLIVSFTEIQIVGVSYRCDVHNKFIILSK